MFEVLITEDLLVQGQLKNSHFLHSVATLIQTPDRIKKLFVKSDRNCVTVRLMWKGRWTAVDLDTKLPFQ